MTPFDKPILPQTYALVRFGLGFPALGSPTEAEAILARLAGPDRTAELWPMISFETAADGGRDLSEARRNMRMNAEAGDEAVRQSRIRIREAYAGNFVTDMIRCATSDDPFRERLHRFWSDHFTARSRQTHFTAAAGGYAEEAIRPQLAGRFAEMLKAAVTHPFMLLYLDQTGSIGPNSPAGRKTGNGLNENLAREVLELHTLGVGGGYSQVDVTQFAELLTGLSYSLRHGFQYRTNWAEPGAEELLGVRYGGGDPALDDIHRALEDLARHPATARHICGKLAAHFVADRPDPDLVAHMERAFSESDGRLPAVYAAMLEHPAAWRDFGAKVKQPVEFMATALRALEVPAETLREIGANQVRKHLLGALGRMGQPYQQPPGPDGWPESGEAWAQPYGLAARIAFAMWAARRMPGETPDPRDFVHTALGDAASDQLIWAASAAATRAEGVGLVLASAEFNRR